jgi:hypothetical protein
MRTRDKMRVFKKFMAGESVRDIAQARHLTIEEVEQVIRAASVKRDRGFKREVLFHESRAK